MADAESKSNSGTGASTVCCTFQGHSNMRPACRAAVCWVASFVATVLPAEDIRKESLEFLSKTASNYEIQLDKSRQAGREDEPIMRWTNTIGHATDAAMFVWMQGARPVAVGTVFITDHVQVGIEFQSLSLERLQLRRGGKTLWEPEEPGVAFVPILEAPPPADTARGRLSQMKALARRFRAEAIKSPPAYQENDLRQLRLLATPVLQYHDAQSPELEGALFAFAMDTDCDVLLLIENRLRDGTPAWEYALARANPYQLRAYCDEELVWSRERIKVMADPAAEYYVAGPYPVKTD